MMIKYVAIAALLVFLPFAQSYAAGVPDWVKANAGWWAEDAISEAEFIQGLQFLINEGIMTVDAESTSEGSAGVPDWVKTNAGWWADGTISDDEFVNAIEHLIKTGVISVNVSEQDSEIQSLQSELDACQDIQKLNKRLQCEDKIEKKIEEKYYRNNSQVYNVGPVTFYYPGLGTEGNEFYIFGGKPILNIRMMAENTGSDDSVALSCTGPAICAYDVWDGSNAFKYASTDFTNGQIVLKSGDSRTFNMMFGPNIGYGGTQLEYDPSKEYSFRISESWGSIQIPLDITK